MPLPVNVNRIFNKYDHKSYSSGCHVYMKASETCIVCIIVHEKERINTNYTVQKLMEKTFEEKPLPSCVRGHFRQESILEFDKWLQKYFKLKQKAE